MQRAIAYAINLNRGQNVFAMGIWNMEYVYNYEYIYIYIYIHICTYVDVDVDAC